MMKRTLKFNGRKAESADRTTSTATAAVKEEVIEWEMRPGGMLVQRRSDNSDVPITLNLRIRVAYGAARYEISVNPHATFGELKKLLTEETGLQPGEQRLIIRGKERENGEYLDMCGVKDRSKVILIEDPESKEKRFMQMRKNAKIQAAYRLINDVSTEIDKLAEQISAIEKTIENGKKVAELHITTLIEMLMRQAVKLDNISIEGDACAQKNLQGQRVQKCVETLDVLKIANAKINPVIVTTKWETFDPPPATTNWELFD
ncbi:PREDICTED: BAG family molecular chaperone regulator 3-like isoform X1 [Nicotiana attenuata]|uniref:Bag family molecular chaperone regulator 3 n=1 Tax=Nicotiana attenuata TaxID=49451 RepID=A0A314KPY6_NICAT|nr:PREDICTED: BAG family molecular chaperone regulator 3-like isoform X1 [Nicotiana attenuata]OIT31323.1 bag family molecular chaperone regulator 3 [Nicotiana attenuata]